MEKNDIAKIELTKSQSNVLKKILEFVNHPQDRVFILKGYAGTGKTTLMRFLIAKLNEQNKQYQLLASTGRAAKVLANLSGQNGNTSTIHSMVYSFNGLNKEYEEKDEIVADANGQLFLVFEPAKLDVDNNPETIYIIDEASIQHRMTIAEYLGTHEIVHDLDRDSHHPIRSENDASHLFELFTQQKLSRLDYEAMEMLRLHYRGRKRVNIKGTETSVNPNRPPIPFLSEFLHDVGFVPQDNGILNRSELEYLTGGWFEEFVYYQVKKYIKPQDLAINVKISRNGIRHNNELDVVFTKGNKLFVIECKTGVQTERLFNEIVYKLCAVSEALLGVSCYSYIFSLKKDDDNVLKRIADNMGITFIDHDILTTPRKLKLTMVGIDIQAKETMGSLRK